MVTNWSFLEKDDNFKLILISEIYLDRDVEASLEVLDRRVMFFFDFVFLIGLEPEELFTLPTGRPLQKDRLKITSHRNETC